MRFVLFCFVSREVYSSLLAQQWAQLYSHFKFSFGFHKIKLFGDYSDILTTLIFL